MFWRFNGNSSLDHWIVTSDSDHGEGYSNCDLKINDQGYGMFSGNLCSRIPKDGKVQNSGYCNMITKRVMVIYTFLIYLTYFFYLLIFFIILILMLEIISTGQLFRLEFVYTPQLKIQR